MPTFQVEMLWDCRVCNATRNHGLATHCPNCGHPKDDRDREYLPDRVSLADALRGDAERRASAGPDWKCKHCESLQSALNACCTECGAPRDAAAKPWTAEAHEAVYDPASGARQGAEHVGPRETVGDAHELVSSLGPRMMSAAMGPPVFSSPSDAGVAVDRRATRPRISRWVVPDPIFFVVGALMLSLGVGLWLLLRPRVYDVRVTDLSWNRTVAVERYQVFHRDGWTVNPGAFNVHDEGQKVHHHDHVRVGSHTEHYTARESCGETCRTVAGSCSTTPVRCTSNKNGSATCSGGDRVCSPDRQSCSTNYCDVDKTRSVDDYEDQPRYATYYDWDVWDWGFNRNVGRSGSTLDVSWPSDEQIHAGGAMLAEGQQERESGRKEEFSVTFRDGKDHHWTLSPQSNVEFQKYEPGSRWRVKTSSVSFQVLPPGAR